MFLKLYVSKDCTDDKLFTKPTVNYNYKIKTIKTGDIYVLSTLLRVHYFKVIKEKDLECTAIITVTS